MNAGHFWQLIKQARANTEQMGDLPAWIRAHLKEHSVEYIIGFEEQLHAFSCQAYDARLWAAAGLMLGFCSDDVFTDFRGWLIAQGKTVYDFALDNPDTLADVEPINGDYGTARLFHMLYAPTKAYREKIGDDIADLPTDYTKPVLLNENVLELDEVKLKEMFPKLYAKYRPVSDAMFSPRA